VRRVLRAPRSTPLWKIPTQVHPSARKIQVMLTAAKEGTFYASSDLCVFFPLAASEGVAENSRLEFTRKNPAPHQGSAWSNSGKALGIEEVVWEIRGGSDDSARYYDPGVGRFIIEDPTKFQGGGNFYRFVDNEPIRLSDPYGLSPADVQRIKDKCKRCTQSLTNGGYRLAGSGWPMGLRNDQKRNWNWLTGKHLFGCKEQAAQNVPCLDDNRYDSHWTFSEWDWWLGLHTVVRAKSDDPNDPIVFCDPWRDFSWTAFPWQPGVGEPIDIRVPFVN